jgi:serine protease
MKKTLTILAMFGLSSSIAHAEKVRLVINQPSLHISKTAYAKSSKQDDLNRCVSSPSGDAQWCIPSTSLTPKTKVRSEEVVLPYKVITLDSYGYSAEDVATFFNSSSKIPFVEVDSETSTPDVSPIMVQSESLTSGTNSDDPYSSSQTRYFGSAENLVLGMNIFSLWENTHVTSKDNPIDVLVLDSSFSASPDVVYDDGRSFTQVPLITGEADQERSDDYTPRAESINQGLCMGHGLGVAGAVGATMDNQIGGAGITNNINLHAIRVMTCGSGFLSDSADALLWLSGTNFTGVSPYQGKPGVVNMSLSSAISECPAFMQTAIDQANEAGFALVVASANQYGDVADRTPSNCDGVIVVAALDRLGDKASFSNVGEEVDLSAAGTDIIAPCNDTEVSCVWDGTSFATPLVSGIVAIIKQATDADTNIIESALNLTAKSNALGLGCEDGVCGQGIPDATAALALVRQIQQPETSTIEFALGQNDECEQAWFVENFGAPLSLCELYKVSFIKVDGVEDISYQLLSVDNNGQWQDAIEIEVFNRATVLLENLNVDNTKYGYRVCRSGECLENILVLNMDLAHDDYRPKGCKND